MTHPVRRNGLFLKEDCEATRFAVAALIERKIYVFRPGSDHIRTRGKVNYFPRSGTIVVGDRVLSQKGLHALLAYLSGP